MTSAEKAKSEPLIDLQRLVVSVRRRRRLWLATALLGLIAGGLVAMFLPSPPTAVAQILVIHPDDSPTDSGTLMRTDVAVLQTTKIANEALKKLNSTQAPEEFLKDYEGLGLTNNVLQLTVKGKSKDEALARAQAISDAFITEYIARNQAAAAATQKALLDQRNQAQNELTTIESGIVTEEAKGRNANPAQLERFYSRRAELNSKISDYDGRAQEAGIGTPKVAAGTQIVDAPRILPRSLLKTLATDAGIGLALGLLAGLALAAVTSVVKDRPVLRREISRHLGASVIAQLPKPPRFLRASRAAARRKRVAATLVRAVRKEGGSVSVLDLGARTVTAALAVDMARELAEKGPVSLVDDLPKANLRELAGDGPIQVLDRGDAPSAGKERRIGVGSIEPGTAWTDLEFLGEEAILVVRTGHANTEWLHTVARQLADRRIPILGVVVVDPDPRDHTDGTLWDGLHTALRGRGSALPEPLPVPARPVARARPVVPERMPMPERKVVPERVARPAPKPVEMFPDEDAPVRRLSRVAPVETDAERTVERVLEPPREKKSARRRPPTPYKRPEDHDNADQPTKRFSPVSPDNAEAL
ncbi:Wzz/FepE/Etk N-terminal domain-containing protein [Amycolatopsis sp. BJA-103]|uniref:Wzz/FepE/Etk N-terminal domain-containing protein n=1 Tax=unclassified Amycolatopsis TaxID=2618356 RepID=UPI000C784532|nr:Wzz/FepE/Etk N-terminal domain-containing protein [Amycolatopsis sp. BJA-103]AUI63197.1 exopolysaccharide biosynthesis protein [Amycolatopsis sp. BJA-103]PNE19041.1 exopolysaccharide biosynthesis protein [Amycolatopsis sp. BJA-103]